MFEYKIKKRLKFLCVFLILLFILLYIFVIRAFLFQDEKNLNILSSQYEKTVLTYYPRGAILDRNNINFSKNTDNIPIQNNINYTIGKTFIGNYKIDETTKTQDSLQGISGLQLYFDDILNGGLPSSIITQVDATGKTINEEDYIILNDHINTGASIKTTVDYHIQKYIEDFMTDYIKNTQINGASIILTDVENGEILAMYSSDEDLNINMLSYQPGSVFKILTLALCVENNLVDINEDYYCSGEININGTTRYCNEGEGHGKINYMQGFADSCNTVYYELAKKLNIKDGNGNIISNEIIEYAKQLGFGSVNDKKNKNKKFFLEYDDYYSFVPDNIYNNLDTFNLALGQGNVQSTPLLLNTIMSAIANDGKTIYPNLILDITSQITPQTEYNQKEVFDLQLKKETIQTLQEALRMVCINGTGKNNSLEQYGGLAGKTGTAENSIKDAPHAWFSGYFPYDNPKYAMTVFVENGGYGSDKALTIFDNIATCVMEMEN